MSTASLEERVEALESQMASVMRLIMQEPHKDAWRSVVGVFADDPDIEIIHQEAQRLREENRQTTRDGGNASS